MMYKIVLIIVDASSRCKFVTLEDHKKTVKCREINVPIILTKFDNYFKNHHRYSYAQKPKLNYPNGFLIC